MADKPSKLLEKNNVRQNRPAFIFIASLFPSVISYIVPYKERVCFFGYNIRIQYVYCYISYIIINIVLLFLSFYLCEIIFNIKTKSIYSFMYLLIIINDVTKAFILSPHTQILNIFVPIFCLWSLVSILTKNFFQRKSIFTISALAGFGATAYSSFFLFLPSIILPEVLIHKPFRLTTYISFLWRSIVIILLSITPSLLWYVYVLYKTGSFYSHSTEFYHHIVWIKEYYRNGFCILLSQLSKNFLELSIFAAKQSWILLLILIPFIVGRSEQEDIQWRKVLISPIVIGCNLYP